MSLKNKSKTNGGFTIIEVLIVLAIAGLILLIVFLAVPALQRNSRNTSMKNDVQNVLGGIAEYQGANNGVLPTGVATNAAGGTVNYTGATATSISIQGTTEVATVTAVPTAPTNGSGGNISTGQIKVYLKAKCNGNNAVTTNNRAAAAFYLVETASSSTLQCVDS
jgi:prepilin-type N-terminal cleavage/methylation domain-containing protein